MAYTVIYSADAGAALRRIPLNWRRRIMDKVTALANNPYVANNNVKKLKGERGFRLRVGDWRVIYTLNNRSLVLHVVDLGTRGGIYD